MYLLHWMAVVFVSAVPLRVAYWVAGRIGILYFNIVAVRRRTVLANLSQVTGKDWTDAEVWQTGRRMFGEYAKYLVDFFRMGRLGASEVKRIIRIENLSNLEAAAARGKGVVALTAHLGNWELGGMRLAVQGCRMNAVALPHEDPRIDRMFVERRSSKGVRVIPVGAAAKRSFAAIRRGEMVALLGDRDVQAKGIGVKFFGRETTVPRGPAVLALRTGAAILPGFAIREDFDRYVLFLEEPILPTGADVSEDQVRKMTQRLMGVLERYIRRYRDQWFMFHPMWPK